jgi:hypothetical protein
MRMRKGQVGQVGRVDRIGRAGVVGCALTTIALFLATPGCSGNTTTAAATTPTVTRTTDTFSGTVAVGGRDFHSFPIAATGTVDVTLTAAAPPSAVVMGITLGIPGDGKCTSLAGGSTQTAAGASVQLSGIASPSTLCVDVRDLGGQSAPVSYTVTVTHP